MRYSAQRDGKLLRLSDTIGGLRASIAPFAGAELASIQKRAGNQWVELLHRAEKFSPTEKWQGRAPWLFPAVGRNYAPQQLEEALRTGKRPAQFEWEHDGRIFPMPIHGFAMNCPWKVTQLFADASRAVAVCELTDNAATRDCFPFGFSLSLETQVADGHLQMTVRVESAKTNASPMPFCLGNHITMRTPLTNVGAFGDVVISAATDAVNLPTRLGLAGEPSSLPLRDGLTLADARLHSLIVGPFSPTDARLKMSDPSGIQIEIAHRELTNAAPKAPADGFHFVLWSLPEERFFCPEPWLGLPNALNTKRGAVVLRAGESFAWEMTVRIS